MINFDDATHTYSRGDVIIPSVSSILSAVLGDSYGAVPQHILDKACEKGTMVHKEVEDFELLGELGFSDEINQYIKLKAEQPFKVVDMEQIVYNDNVVEYAGRYDITTEDALMDIKTSYKLDHERTSWQLSLYNYAMGMKFNKFFAIWLRPEKAELVELEVKTKEQVEEFLLLYKNGETLSKAIIELDSKTEVMRLKENLKFIKELEERAEALKSAILKEMTDRNIKKYDDGELIITVTESTTRQEIDKKALKEKYPDIAKELTKEIPVKQSIRFKIKE